MKSPVKSIMAKALMAYLEWCYKKDWFEAQYATVHCYFIALPSYDCIVTKWVVHWPSRLFISLWRMKAFVMVFSKSVTLSLFEDQIYSSASCKMFWYTTIEIFTFLLRKIDILGGKMSLLFTDILRDSEYYMCKTCSSLWILFSSPQYSVELSLVKYWIWIVRMYIT